jgi:hypothetical protein
MIINLFTASKIPEKSQNQQSTQNKKSFLSQICVLENFKVKKLHNMNSPHQMEPFEEKKKDELFW